MTIQVESTQRRMTQEEQRRWEALLARISEEIADAEADEAA